MLISRILEGPESGDVPSVGLLTRLECTVYKKGGVAVGTGTKEIPEAVHFSAHNPTHLSES